MKTEYVFGIHVLESLLRNRPETILEIQVLEARDDRSIQWIQQQAGKQGISVRQTDRKTLDKLTDNAVHQGAVARIQMRPLAGENQMMELVADRGRSVLLLFLDGIQDPHNLGACIRTAEAAGADAVIFQKDRAATLSASARKAAAGAAERLPLFQVPNLGRSIEHVKQAGIWVIGATGQGRSSLYSLDFQGPTAIVVGAEGTGLRTRIQQLCDHLVAIPLARDSDSLNVSVATGVVLFEVRRQRQKLS